MARTLRPSALTSSATLSALSTWRSGIAMSAPCLAMARTIPRPMPLPPPVTTATLPARRLIHSSVHAYNRAFGGPHDITATQKSQLVRPSGSRRLRTSLVAEDRGLQRSRLRRPSGGGCRELVVGAHELQRASPPGRRRREARRVV